MEALGPSNISGIGLDTNAIVDAIMAAERSNAVLLEVRQAETTNMISAYRAVEAKFLAIQAQLGSLTRSSTFTRGTFSVSDPDGLDVAASGSVAPGTFDVRVLELARNHQLASQGIDDPDNTVLGTGDFKISVGAGSQQTIEVDSTNNTLEGLRQAINRADAGVTATIVNDGTTVNSNRLVLTAKDTGAKNTISVQSTLTGGVNPDFATSSFDTPETDGFSALATSAVTLGPTAAYTGSQNKTYTFTVAGTGTQIVGTDSITINYTDGTDTGSIVVNQADTEVALTGAGSDGLTLSFSAGDLVAGDTFTVSTFSPILQNPATPEYQSAHRTVAGLRLR
ncbi:MAG: flagellar filament capping protein FliD [Candidatus Zixiibacteriota bacterium]